MKWNMRMAVWAQEHQEKEWLGESWRPNSWRTEGYCDCMLKKCNGNLQDGMNIGQRIDSLKGRQVRTFMDNNRCLYSAVLARMAEKSPCVISAMGE
jgi:hypothetical protein